MNEKKDLNSNWLFVAPISGIELTKSTSSELKVGKIIFVSKKRLPRIREKLGVPVRISELDKFGVNQPKDFKEEISEFFKYSKVYAVCSFSGTPNSNQIQNIRLIEDAINLISFSSLGYTTRKFQTKIEIKQTKGLAHFRTIALDKINKRLSISFKTLHPLPLELNEDWLGFHKKYFFIKFLKIINGDIRVNGKWKGLLISVGKLVGDSFNSHNIPEAFLKNVIALEMLLVNQGEKIEEKLIERSGYFLDWSENWKKDKIKDKLKIIYKKRCDYVHDGKTINISKDDLIFTDDLIFNLINNIITHIDKISSKGKLIRFSDNYLAEKKLGIESNYQFGKFQFVRRTYSKIEFEEI